MTKKQKSVDDIIVENNGDSIYVEVKATQKPFTGKTSKTLFNQNTVLKCSKYLSIVLMR